MNSVYSFQLNS